MRSPLESMPLRDIIHAAIKAFLVNVEAERGDCDRAADSEMSAIATWTANVVCRFMLMQFVPLKTDILPGSDEEKTLNGWQLLDDVIRRRALLGLRGGEVYRVRPGPEIRERLADPFLD